ncbi:hypothetical protein AWU65_08210 [Paenibacillus glucanolyticus]|uniref:Uncharacterized protein n=1 Tax=Paenibacillus glucanolyticus TaxID=59843 RepID=A0A163ICG0_9BACL|nr:MULTISPECIES: hypothetical protein [Paenibacillus]AWP30639.1 hypothetical protein B9D94_30290 [Paenibacillus sp. Cedars]KZS45898.1 hypothetical protein AWU65_08210 [Paenibacillus glucanolyticus]
MKLYPEMFLSPWHLIVLLMVLIAFIGLIMGGYDKKTVLRSTGLSALIFYFMLTIPIGLITQESLYKEETMIQSLDQRYEDKQANGQLHGTQDYVIAYVGAYKNEDDADIVVYAGNYHATQTFSGHIRVYLYDSEDEEVFIKTYEGVTLEPGEKKKLDSTFTSHPMTTYRFHYEAQPEV